MPEGLRCAPNPAVPLQRRRTLNDIYDRYAGWAAAFPHACAKGCATCCTRSVTMTTLEGELILAYLAGQPPPLRNLAANLPRNCSSPATTTNQFAAACLQGREAADDPGSWDLSPCPFLQDGSCAIYTVRPFMCRAFASRVRCDRQGAAEVDPLLLSLNTAIMQCIEHLDRGRPWGNLNAILCWLTATGRTEQEATAPSLRSQPLPGFLLLPEEEQALAGILKELLNLLESGEPKQNRPTVKPPAGL